MHVLFGFPLAVPLNQPEKVTLKTSIKRYSCFSKQAPTLFEWLLCCFGPYSDKHQYRSVWSWSPFLVGCRGTPKGKPMPFWSLQKKQRTKENRKLTFRKIKGANPFLRGPYFEKHPWIEVRRKRWAVIRWRRLPPGARRGPPVCARGMPTCRCIIILNLSIQYVLIYFRATLYT